MTAPHDQNGSLFAKCPHYTNFVEVATNVHNIAHRLSKVEEIQEVMRDKLTRTVVIVGLVQTVAIALLIAWANRAFGLSGP